MTWVRVENDYQNHPKILSVGIIGEALHLRAICYASRYLTDGFIPDAVVPTIMLGVDPGTDWPAKMVSAGLWDRVDGGYLVRNYLEYQSSKKQVQKAMKQKSQSGKRGAKVRWNKLYPAVTESIADAMAGAMAGAIPGAIDSGMHTGRDTGTGTKKHPPTPRGGKRVSVDLAGCFREWYAEYPRHVAPAAASRAYLAAVRSRGATPDVLLGALRRQLPDFRQRPADRIPYPASWLNGEHWRNESEPAQQDDDPYKGMKQLYTCRCGQMHDAREIPRGTHGDAA